MNTLLTDNRQRPVINNPHSATGVVNNLALMAGNRQRDARQYALTYDATVAREMARCS